MYSLIFSISILLLFACIVFWNCERHSYHSFSRESCLIYLNQLRGIFAVEIVIGHVVRDEHTILYPLGKFMICSVAFFFFVSAFGMAVSYEKGTENLAVGGVKYNSYVSTRFILSKPVYLLILSIIVFALGIVVDVFCNNDLSYIASPIVYTYLVKTNWYIWSMIIFYLLFFFAYKYAYKYHIFIICVVTVLLSILMYLNGFAEAWLASSFAFPFGLIVGEHFSAVKEFIFSWKGFTTLIILSIFGLSCLMVSVENMVSLVFMRNSMCLATIMILLYMCSFFKLGNNSIARWLNRYSAGIYLSQFIWLEVTESYGLNYMIRIPVVLAATLLSGMLLYPISTWIKRLLCRHKVTLKQ